MINSIDHLRYIFRNLDTNLVKDIERFTPGGLQTLCLLYTHSTLRLRKKYNYSNIILYFLLKEKYV